ncbi:acetyl-CoA acetyltransferase [Mycolicibacterium chubuense NBB4]|uniref:Probable acetyl-CoA acetyltransferase n=1 Tax=Mycolicibacterium chubuense (strain NBB4) TaxID=710421 RepID=I4BQP1_MYCCN|nr:thiolase family protein [Mycolicibacterium chubuense]AFM19598.1 acetyl-CoA acetyltransferase [Mycolicibacterium chubuense NBB4]
MSDSPRNAMPDAVVVAYARTPFTRSLVGGLAKASEFELASAVIRGVIDRSGLDPALIDTIVLGEVLQGGGCIARYSALDLGLPLDIPAYDVGGWCTSGMVAMHQAVAGIRAGMARCVVAGGLNTPSQSPLAGPHFATTGITDTPIAPMHPGIGEMPALDLALMLGEGTATQFGLTRAEVDDWAARAHALACEAHEGGVLDAEKVAVDVGGAAVFDDELPSRDLTLEALASMNSFVGEDCTVTVGNQTGLTDGAAAVLICEREFALAHGMTPLARITGWSVVGSTPEGATEATITATRRALDVAGVDVGAVDLFDVHDSYASIGVAYERSLGVGRDRLNVHGGGLALGHPYGASGTRVASTLINELQRRGGGVGAGAIVSAGGLGAAIVLDVMPPVQ